MPPRRKPFAKLRQEAKDWFMKNPSDLWRLKVSMDNDNPEKFFRRSIFDVGSADIYRWVAACQALREILDGKSDLGTQDDG
jgi:hypothetical protein